MITNKVLRTDGALSDSCSSIRLRFAMALSTTCDVL